MNTTLEYYNNHSVDLYLRYENADVADLHRLLLKYISLNTYNNIFELGFGSGREIAMLLKKGYNVVGIDGSAQMIECALKCHPELEDKISRGVLPTCIKNINEKYTLIYSIACLMHLTYSEIAESFSYIHKILNSLGLFIFSVPIRKEGIDNDSLDENKRLFTILSRKIWGDLFLAAGFQVIEENVSSDGLNRESVLWVSYVLKKVDF